MLYFTDWEKINFLLMDELVSVSQNKRILELERASKDVFNKLFIFDDAPRLRDARRLAWGHTALAVEPAYGLWSPGCLVSSVLTQSWYIVLFKHCWILFANSLFRIFALIIMRGVEL